MSFCDRQEPVKFVCFWVGGLAISLGLPLLYPLPGLAQLIPDGSLGAESSLINPDGNLNGLPTTLIEGGAARGSNLFHSFQEFNVNTGQSVYFANPIDIENILSRVTGNGISNIDGLLGVTGAANLFLLNPNGVIFGPNARLDISGSFLTSTGSSFAFADGSEFSAVPPGDELLSVSVPLGVQFNNPQGDITSAGRLQTGQDLSLIGNTVSLTGQVTAGNDLTLQAANTVQIRDAADQPFVAAAGNNLLVQGNQAVDIFALNHADSGLQAGGNLTLRSPTPVIGDAHYQSGGDFRIEQLDETPGDLLSPNDPAIRATGNVEFGNYEGASLHVLAGGSVTAGDITITGADPANGLVETVTLSDGSTFDINGKTTPTLDIRAGTLAVNPEGAIGDMTGFAPPLQSTDTAVTMADITLGNIRNEGGTVFLTNQYEPNAALTGGDITVSSIDTSTSKAVNVQVVTAPSIESLIWGGDVVLEARRGIAITKTDSVSTFAVTTYDVFDLVDFGVTVEAIGGAIRLSAQDAITTGNLDSSARVNADLITGVGILLEAGGEAFATGEITDIKLITRGGAVNLTSNTLIKASEIISSADADLEASADQFPRVMGRGIGNIALTTDGGAINLKSGNSIAISDINSSADANANISTGEIVGPPGEAGGTRGDIGNVTLTTRAGEINLKSGASIQTGNLDALASGTANVAADFVAVESDKGIGDVRMDTFGGVINLESNASIGTGNIRSTANANSDARARGSVVDQPSTVDNVEGGSFFDFEGNPVDSFTQADLQDGSISFIPDPVEALDAVPAFDITLDDGDITFDDGDGESVPETPEINLSRKIENIGDAQLTTYGGDIALKSNTSIETGDINSSSSSTAAATVGGKNFDNAQLTTYGGNITLKSSTSIETSNINSSSSSTAVASVGGDDISDAKVIAQGGMVELTGISAGVTLNQGSSIRSNVLSGNGRGGDIRISGAFAQLTQNSLTTTVTEKGDAGDIVIDVSGNVFLSESRLLTGRELGTQGRGAGGNILINGSSIELSNFSFLNTATFGLGDAGNVELTTTEGDIRLEDSSIFSLTTIEGNAGDIEVRSASALHLEGNSSISTNVALGATGEGGNILIEAPSGVFIRGVGQVQADNSIGTQPNLFESEPNGSFRVIGINEDAFNLIDLDEILANLFITKEEGSEIAQSVDGSFGLADNPNVLLSTEVPYVAISGKIDGDRGPQNLDEDFDYYSFSVESVGTQITFDIDAVVADDPSKTLDLSLRLEDDQGSELAVNDSAPTTLSEVGSTSSRDPYFTYIFNKPGTYFIKVQSTDSESGTYTLNISRVDSSLNTGITTQTRSSGRSGNITLNAPTINIQNFGQISAETLGDGQAGDISLQPFNEGPIMDIQLGTGSSISSSSLPRRGGSDNTSVTGNSGRITLIAPEAITLSGPGDIRVETNTTGNAGGLELTAPQITLNGIEVSASTEFPEGLSADQEAALIADRTSGRGGDIDIDTSLLTLLNGSEITAATSSAGDGGDVSISSLSDELTIQGNGSISVNTENVGSAGTLEIEDAATVTIDGVTLSASTSGAGPGGNVELEPATIRLANGGQIAASTAGPGDGGNIIFNSPSDTLTLTGTGTISVETSNTGRAGRFTDGQNFAVGRFLLQVPTINIDGVQLSASTTGPQAGGDIAIQTTELTFANGGAIAASTSGSGQGGSLTITGNSPLTLQGNGRLTVASLGADSGRAGDLNVLASDRLRLSNGVELSVTSESAQGGGNINIAVEGGSLVMRSGSFINATSTNPSAGDGGNITIRLSDGFLIAAPGQNNDIIANAVGGNGGNINISALRLFGFSLQDEPNVSLLRGNRTNDISASSQVGLPGSIALDTLALDPSQGLVELPLNLEDRANQVTPSCGLGNTEDGSEFVVTGRGGLPPNPNEPLAADGVSVPWVMDEGDPSTVAVTPPPPATTPLLLEANEVAIDADGNAYFVAQGSTAAAVSQSSSSFCRSVSTPH